MNVNEAKILTILECPLDVVGLSRVFELIFCVCEYSSILFTIKKREIGKEKKKLL